MKLWLIYPAYKNIGPMAALLTAFVQYPQADLLVTGCDYPFISGKDVKEFLTSVKEKKIATAFYNNEQQLYEPLLLGILLMLQIC